MPRVHSQTKSTRGREVQCGHAGCGRKIEPGERYFSWSFRYGGTQYRCAEHPPRQSELTQSRMSEIYAAVEDAENRLPEATSVGEVGEIVSEVAEVVREVQEAYREAAESFGGAGENGERADVLEGWADELESFEAEEGDEEPTDEEVEEALREIIAQWMDVDILDLSDRDAVIAVFQLDEAEVAQRAVENRDGGESEALGEARSEASDLIVGCPL